MRRIVVAFAVVSASLFALPLEAQDEGGDIAMIAFFRAKPGMNQQLEEGLAKHAAFHREQQDTDRWAGWTVISGENTGTHARATFGHRWEDFDNPTISPDADAADRAVNIDPYVANVNVQYWRHLPEVSRTSDQPAAMSVVVVFETRFGSGQEMRYLLGKFHEAISRDESRSGSASWNVLANGGQGGTYALVLPRKNWAAFQNPGLQPFWRMMAETHGEVEAAALRVRWRKVVKSSSSHIEQARPDFSNIPEGQ